MAVGVNIVTNFDAKGIKRAISDFHKLEGAGAKSTFALRTVDSALSNGLINLAKYGAAAAAVAAVVGKKFVDAGSALEESQSKVGVVFGQSAGMVREFAKTAAASLGISQQAALEAAGTYGNLFQAFGIGREKATDMSTTLVTLAADLASFNNTNIEDALQALRSGLSGETEPLKRFGVALNDVRLKEVAFTMGLYDGSGALSVSAKAQAAYQLILKDTSLAQGDFARTSDGAANQQRILIASFKDVQAEIGTALLPVFKEIVSFIQDQILPRVQAFADAIGDGGLAGGLRYLGTEALAIIGNLGTVGTVIYGLTAAFVALRLVTVAATIAQTLFGEALFKTPMGRVVALLIALGVAVAAAYVRFEGFRDVVHAVINAIIGALERMVNGFISKINIVIKVINGLSSPLRAIGINLPVIGQIGEVQFGRITNAAKFTGKAISDVIDKLRAVRNAERGAVITKAGPPKPDPDDPTGPGESPVDKARKQLAAYIDALKGVTRAQRSARDATRDVASANLNLVKATAAVTKAQEHFNRVTTGYGRDSKQARDGQRELDKAQRAVERSGYRVEGAVFAVRDAEKKLAELRAGSSEEAKKAEINLAAAKVAVRDAENDLADARKKKDTLAISKAEISLSKATLKVRDAEKDLAETRKGADAQAIREAEIELAEAKLAVKDATDSQAEATDDLAKAERRLDEAVNGAKEGSDAYAEALAALNSAKDDQTAATERVADAIEKERDALVALIEAERELAKVRAATPAAVVAKAEAAAAVVAAATRTTAPAAVVPTPIPALTSTPTPTPRPMTGIGAAEAAAVARGLFSQEVANELIQRRLGMVPMFAAGGIVTRPTLGIVGDSGPEAIIPLGDHATGTTINIVVNAGMGTDGAEIGDQIVDVLKRYERRNGPLPLAVSG
jgi:hypothetical protein